jgi:hypothetical protein
MRSWITPTYKCRQTQRIFRQRIDPPHAPAVPSRRYRQGRKYKAQQRHDEQRNLPPVDNFEAGINVRHETHVIAAFFFLSPTFIPSRNNKNIPRVLERKDKNRSMEERPAPKVRQDYSE